MAWDGVIGIGASLSSRDTSSQIFDNSIVALTVINDFVAFGRVDECFDEGDAVACDADDTGGC